MSTAPRPIPPSVNSWNAEFIETQYQQFKTSPESVSPDLRAFFQGFDLALASGSSITRGETSGNADGSRFQQQVDSLVEAYRSLGHLAAAIDPFGRARPRPASLALEYHGLSQGDLDRPVQRGDLKLPGVSTLRLLIEHLEQTYCRAIAFEVNHIRSESERTWLIEKIESVQGRPPVAPEDRRHILEQLLRAEEFENFLQKRYPGDKRFSLEGSESTIPLLDRLIEAAGGLGAEEMVFGMAHRGRLNVLNNIMGKTYEQIFTEFEDNYANEESPGGDVKYHKGYSGVRTTRAGRQVHLAMASNPSHLESVNPIVEGRTRAKQRLRGDIDRKRVIPVLIHGDAAVAGQGIVAELCNMAYLEGYTTGGSVHVVLNNLIGFTTIPEDGRSSTYCTDVAKMIDSPVFHVNGEDPESVVFCAQLAMEFRQQFKRDAWIDLYCYRKYGHNEQDEATFTQPLLYALIKKKNSVLKVYAERLLAEGVITEADMSRVRTRLEEALNKAQDAAKKKPFDPTIDPGSARWKGMGGAYSHTPVETGVKPDVLKEVCGALGRVPTGFNLNPKLKSVLEGRAALPVNKHVSYADGESLAIGTLLLEGTAVRISGQDCRRGTFSHRHAVLRDMQTNEPYTPLNNIREVGDPGTDKPALSRAADGRTRQARLCVYDSPLSEYSVLGFDYGYSLADPNMLVCWEGQFGDFCNGAQIIIDQYLASAEVKWDRWSGLVMLLPHGYEHAGPEHSSARLERFLQLCASDNMQVVVPTTGAQIFHLLRRQVRRDFRKPLIVMTPKGQLRTPTSQIDELATGSFRETLDDPAFVSGGLTRKDVKRLILCSGKVYFDLAERREKLARRDVAIVRLEQLYPFHAEQIAGILKSYPKSAELVWAQEEPRNAGAFTFVDDALRTHLGVTQLMYIGRDACASPAVGSKHVSKDQQESILVRAMGALPDAKQTKAPGKPAARVNA